MARVWSRLYVCLYTFQCPHRLAADRTDSRADPGMGVLRLDAHAVIKDKSSSDMVYIHYQGKIKVDEGLGKILTRADDMKDTEYGNACKSTVCMANLALQYDSLTRKQLHICISRLARRS